MTRGKKKVDRDWTPALRGETYCSPACGGGCTRRNYDQAVRDAEKTVRRMRGSGWRARVWENLGWHFSVVSGPVQIYADRLTRHQRLRYRCLISDHCDEPSGGSGIWTDKAPERSYADPNEAVSDMLAAALLETSKIVRSICAAYVATGSCMKGFTLGSVVLKKGGKSLGEVVRVRGRRGRSIPTWKLRAAKRILR